MYVTITHFRDWLLFALLFFGLGINFWGCLFRRGSLYFSHKFLLLFLFFEFVFVDLRLFGFFLLIRVFGFGLTEITVELVSSGAALLIILVLFLIFEISEIVLSLILPERIFLFVLFPVHEVIHFGTSSFSETHLLDCQVFGRQ